MTEYGILFSAPMVRAILEDRKTVTRRLSERWLRVKVGDRLIVRETWRWYGRFRMGIEGGFEYRANQRDGCKASTRMFQDFPDMNVASLDFRKDWDKGLVNKWRSPLHMQKWMSRITLEATEDARRERLWDITEKEALAEGIRPDVVNAVTRFVDLWHSVHSRPGEKWEDNPMVTRIAFRRIG